MFTYRCPACGKHHTADKNFEKAFEAKCLRCGSLIDVTPELIQQAPGAASSSVTLPPRPELFTKAPAGSGVRVAKAASVTAPAVDDPALDAPSLPEDSATVEAAPRKKGPSKRKEPARNQDDKADKKTPAKPEPANEQKEETATDPERPRWTPPEKTPPSKKGLKPRWQLIAAVSAVVLVLFGAIGFFSFGGKKATSKPRAKPVANKTTPKPTPKPAPPPPPQKVEPAVQGPPPADVIVSAPRLSAELAANADFANIQYSGKILEVSGLLAKIENKEGLRPPARPHAVFATSGTPISCDLQDSKPGADAWNRLKANQPFTIRGKYEKKGYLSGCFLMPSYTSSADSRYKDKIIEVSGRVASVSTTGDSQQQFPTVVFEGETNSVMSIRCLFRMTDAAEVSKIQPGSDLTIQGRCGGRQGDGKSIRLDNCVLVYTSAPPPKVVRIHAIAMLREYEEDLRLDFLPPPGEESQIPTVWTIRQLYNTYTADPKSFVQKHRNHILHLRCKAPPPQQLRGTRGKPLAVTLTSGDTDLAFQIECYFSAAAGEELSKHSEAEYQIRGLFTGQIDAKKLRLDNCDVDMPRRAGPSLTADYLPHKAGRTFTIDVATFGTMVNGKARDVVQREVHVQGEGGVTEIVLTHAGPLTGKSLFDEGVQEKWVQQKKVAIKAPATTGLYFRRLNAGFVELGTPYPVAKGKPEVSWMPMVKLHAQAGDKWKLESPAGPRDFVLEKFDEFQGHPCAVIRELFTPASDILHPLETLHVYAQDLGEVERRQWRHLDQRGGKILISEMKRVAKPEAGLETKPAAKPAAAPARPASEPRPSGRGSKSTR